MSAFSFWKYVPETDDEGLPMTFLMQLNRGLNFRRGFEREIENCLLMSLITRLCLNYLAFLLDGSIVTVLDTHLVDL
jgi:hypothetical protein